MRIHSVRSKFLWRRDRGAGDNSERCLKWGVGVIQESYEKHLEIGVGKDKNCW